MAL
ncbi:hypothetical protein YPPY15_3054, partial [Yersinia pestis PY-15]|jgi:putative ABC transport system permease protein